MNASTYNLNPEILTRQQRFKIWKALSRVTYTGLGRHMGISHVAARAFCLGESAPAERVAQLREIGVPEELLPPVTPPRYLSGPPESPIAERSDQNAA